MLILFLKKKVTPSCPQKTIVLLSMDLSFKMTVSKILFTKTHVLWKATMFELTPPPTGMYTAMQYASLDVY